MADLYRFKLYITGQTARSEQAIASIRSICDDQLGGRAELSIIDVLDEPELAEAEKILATPTLVRVEPPPRRRIIGELSHVEEVIFRLGLPHQPPGGAKAGEGEGAPPPRDLARRTRAVASEPQSPSESERRSDSYAPESEGSR